MKKPGFTLIELLMYTALVIILMPIMYSSLTHFLRLITSSIAEQQQAMRTSLALDVLRRDALGVSEALFLDNRWFFKRQGIDAAGKPVFCWVSWCASAQGAVRWKGNLNVQGQHKSQSQTQCFAGALQHFTCTPHFNEQNGKLCTIIATYRYKTLQHSVFLPVRSVRYA